MSEASFLEFSVVSGGPVWLEERLSVSGERCEYDVRAASAPQWLSTRAGLFAVDLGADDVRGLEEIARNLVALDAAASPVEGHLTAVAVVDGGRAALDLDAPSPTRTLSAAEDDARAAFRGLAERCWDAPVAAVELAVTTMPGSSGPSGPWTARFQLTNVGTEPIALRLDPSRLQISWDGGSWAAAGSELFLVDANAGYLGGGIVPAALAPGAVGYGAAVDAIGSGEAAQGVAASVEGTLRRDDADVRFRVAAAAHAGGAAS